MRSSKNSRSTIKQFVLDTNVLIHDPQSMLQFQDNVVWLPVEVLEELDRFKPESTTRGANARLVHRQLSKLFQTTADMQNGVRLPSGGSIRVAINRAVEYANGEWVTKQDSERFKTLQTMFPDLSIADNRILASAAFLADGSKTPTILVTKDLNMQLKARTLGLEAQDYRTDRVDDSDIPRTQGQAGEEYMSLDVDGHALQAFATGETLHLEKAKDLAMNEYVLLRNVSDLDHGIPARHAGQGHLRKLRNDTITIRGGKTFRALNLGQRFLLDALYDPAVSLLTVYGKAGTGKTLLSVGAALQQVQDGLYEKLLITRVIMPTGRDIGFLPGTKEEKMQPWVQPSYDALEQLLVKPKVPEHMRGRKQSARKGSGAAAEAPATNGHGKQARPYDSLLQNGMIEIEAIAHIRGRSIPHALFIVDEAQQLTPHEAKTLVTRMGRHSKMIMIGDLAQIDNPYVDAHTNGLVYTRNRLRGQGFMAHINLFKGERSEMAEVAANLM